METLGITVWGSTGYAGQELMNILRTHPNIGWINAPGHEPPPAIENYDAAFLALPAGESAKVAKELRSVGNTVIDLSGDFRFQTAEEYETWYHQKHPAPQLIPAPYALPEMSREGLSGSKLISMPGCYPTATLLGVKPVIENGLLADDSLITVDAISGVSGMGRRRKEEADQIIAAKSVQPYKVGRVHQHVGEIEQFLDGREIFFSPSVGPFFRGMLVKITAELGNNVGAEEVNEALSTAYDDEPFVHVIDELPTVSDTVNTDLCVIGSVVTGNTVQIVSSIDNLRKGAASQAIQAFNIALGLPETAGLQAA